ncbi:glycoside hydrolase family 16 protein [Blastococcus litoris]|uniref:glycoside hydrolase family 16 protein n=1 Tax=Blastococcus litoris TaxID=2171622 RepID=UPI000E3071E0|nr:glycoside hydrolase family 16 protein [Blastococcus litoris]
MPPSTTSPVFADEFDGTALDRSVWLPHYLPAWSSRAATAATYHVGEGCLRLSIPRDQGLWLPGEHEPPLRVSGVQSGNFSGPAGSTTGQQPWRDGAVVREEQETFWGWTPDHGRLEMRARAELTPRSMAAWWMVGLEDVPEHSAEICVFEVFGDAVEPGVSAAVGMGLHAFRDPATPEDFAAVRLPIDVAEFHTYAVDWTPERAEFSVDGEVVRSCPQPPAYPVQMMVAVFDFPDRAPEADDDAVPLLVVDHLRGSEN